MTYRKSVVPSVFALVLCAGCASTKITPQSANIGQLPRPSQIVVYDFISSPADLPPGSPMAGQFVEPSTPPSPEDIAAGRELGAEMATKLASAIQDMGLPGVHGTRQTMVHINDIVLRGYLLSIHKGSEAERMALGFGAGASELKTEVEAYQMTPQGLRRLGGGVADSGGAKGPGAVAPAAVAIATGNPIGLIVSSGVKIYGEASGKAKVQGRADATVQEIAGRLKTRFQEQGWIP